jgi:hypothetical protein
MVLASSLAQSVPNVIERSKLKEQGAMRALHFISLFFALAKSLNPTRETALIVSLSALFSYFF